MNKQLFVLVIDGPMGSGKSTIGEKLQKRLKRTALLNTERINWFISDYRRTAKDNAIVNEVLYKMADEYLKHGINLLIPQGFWHRKHINPYFQLAKKYNAKVFVFHLNAPRPVLLERVKDRKYKANPLMSKTHILNNIKKWENGRFKMGLEFETDKVTPGVIVKTIMQEVASK